MKVSDQTLVIEIVDNGEGIDAASLPYLFDRYYRTNPDQRHDSGRTGLGLAIASSIVQLHAGQLNAYSAGRGQGSKFTIKLPLSAQAKLLQK